MKKNVVLLGLLLGLSVCLIIVGYVFDRVSKPDAKPIVSDAQPHIEVSVNETEVSLVGPVVEEWLQWETNAAELYTQYRPFGRVYGSKSIILQWGVFDIPDGSFITKQYFELSTMRSFEDARRYEMKTGERSIELHHLLVDTAYFFRITMELENNQACVEEGCFQTKWSPRIIDLDNLRNIRDVGGWKTADGKSVRQGLLYRGCELDGATDGDCVITETSADVMVEELKIKTELDLRSSDTVGVQDMLGVDVTHHYFALPSYQGIFTDAGESTLRLVFATLSQKDNYPMYLHCTDGSARTGMVCFLLEALLGVPEEDCYREWELSILADGSPEYQQMDGFVKELCETEGNTLQEKTENYLLSIGVTAEEIADIRSILLPS